MTAVFPCPSLKLRIIEEAGRQKTHGQMTCSYIKDPMLPQKVVLSCPSTCFFSKVMLGFQLTSLNTRASPQVIGVSSKPDTGPAIAGSGGTLFSALGLIVWVTLVTVTLEPWIWMYMSWGSLPCKKVTTLRGLLISGKDVIMVSLFQRRLSFKGIHMTRFQHHDMVVFVFLHTFSMCKYMCSPSLWQKLPHLVRVDQNICELDIWKPIDLQTSKAFTLYVFAIIAIDLIGHQDFTGNNKGDGAYPGEHQLNDVGSFQNFTKVLFTLNNCEQSIPLMFLLLKNWRISLRWLRFFGCLFLLKLLFLLFLLILRYEVSVLPRTLMTLYCNVHLKKAEFAWV